MYYVLYSVGRRPYRQSRPLSAPRFDGDHLLTEKSYPTTSYKDHGDSEPLPYHTQRLHPTRSILLVETYHFVVYYILYVYSDRYTHNYISHPPGYKISILPYFFILRLNVKLPLVCVILSNSGIGKRNNKKLRLIERKIFRKDWNGDRYIIKNISWAYIGFI